MEHASEAATGLLEPQNISVTDLTDEKDIDAFEVVKHRCRCWFCPDCCETMGRQLRAKLEPILETFKGLLLATFTVDPTLFDSPKAAYFYMRERRCMARTIQDLYRKGFLHSRRYFYVVEWQKKTEQAHFHVLLDASFVPWVALLESWGKHRPDTAGPVVGSRPAFGTVLISVPKFAGGSKHAASYVTKYLTKTPEHGFPQWVLDLGADTRIRRYSASRGFWGEPSEPPACDANYKPDHSSYRVRVGRCGNSVDVFETRLKLDKNTGELYPVRSWLGELDVSFQSIATAMIDPRSRPTRRAVNAENVEQVLSVVERAAGHAVKWKRGGPVEIEAESEQPLPWDVRAEIAHEKYLRNYDTMIRQFVESNQ